MNKSIRKPVQLIDSHMWSLVHRIIKAYLRPYLKNILAAMVFMVVSAALTAAFAKLIQPILDDVLVARKEHLIVPMALAVFVCFFANGLATYFHTLIMNKVGQSIISDIQRDLFSRLILLDLKFFHENASGQLISRMVNDVSAMRVAVSDSITGLGKNLLTLIALAVLMFIQDWHLALIAICIFPPVTLFINSIGRRLRKASRNTQSEVAGMTSIFLQIFQGMRQVKAYGMEAHESDRAGKAIDAVKKRYFKGYNLSNLSTPVNETLIGIVLTSLIIYGGYQVIGGHLTVGGLMSFIAAFAMSYEPLKRMAKTNNNLQMGLGAAERVFEMMDQFPQIVEKTDAKVLATNKPDIVFENVSFAYGENINALDNVSFTIPAGKVTALVGVSGSGKTTAMNMVPRLYDAISGRVLVGGLNVRDVTLSSLRQHIALVSQDITIFDESARLNILYGRPGASDEEVAAAAKAAAADDFIRKLPEGYETKLGENGTRLSGGQRQRISIARAILRNAPILLLDEATSALDNESERAIQASLEELQKGRTTLVIAHRLSTVQNADQIIVLDRGKVVESGTHAELLARNGAYAKMYSLGLAAA